MANILIVDDSEIYLEMLRFLLEDGGHTVVGEALDGAEGVVRYKELHPDITTLDITMPVLDGIGALKEIMEYDPLAKVVMMSSSAQKHKVAEAMMYGAADFLAKPFESETILESIANILQEGN